MKAVPVVRCALVGAGLWGHNLLRVLGGHDLVFGPAEDGGFWLVGARRRPRLPRLFERVRWSSPFAFADTLAALEQWAARDPRIRLVHAPHGGLTAALNRGLSEARGPICQKMDDDDWYAPRFLETMVSAFRDNARVVCRPTLAFLMPFLFFDIARWEVRQSVDKNAPGATLLFSRDDWKERPFRALPGDEDVWFFLDQTRLGVSVLPVQALELFLAVRHAGSRQDRGHTWTHQGNGLVLEEYLKHRPVYKRGPEALLPDWALEIYRDLRRDPITTPAVGTVPASLD